MKDQLLFTSGAETDLLEMPNGPAKVKLLEWLRRAAEDPSYVLQAARVTVSVETESRLFEVDVLADEPSTSLVGYRIYGTVQDKPDGERDVIVLALRVVSPVVVDLDLVAEEEAESARLRESEASDAPSSRDV